MVNRMFFIKLGITLICVCFGHIALSTNNIASQPQLQARLIKVLTNITALKQRVEPLSKAVAEAEARLGDIDMDDEGVGDWIRESKIIPVVKGLLAHPKLTNAAPLLARLAVLADDEESFRQAIDAGANHQSVWSLVGFNHAMFERVVVERLEEGSLHYAAAHGKRAEMATLLAKGADINAVDGYGWSALDYAVFNGQAETTQDLCEADADVCVLDYAKHMLNTDSPTVKVLHTYAGDKHPTKESWLHYYIRKGQTARAINHIKSDNDPDKLIHIGVRGIIDVGGYKYREDIDGTRLRIRAESALHAASLYGDLELVKYLIETMQMDVNYQWDDTLRAGTTALHMTAVGNHVDVASYLLERGADVHVRDKGATTGSGLTPMHYAAAYGNLEMAMLLAANGADVDAVGDGWGYNYWRRITPLQLAIEGAANLELVEFLIKKLGWFRKREKINRADGRGLTPLYRAVRSKNPEMVELLLDNGADPAVLINYDRDLIGGIRYDAERNNDATTLRIVELLKAHLPQR